MKEIVRVFLFLTIWLPACVSRQDDAIKNGKETVYIEVPQLDELKQDYTSKPAGRVISLFSDQVGKTPDKNDLSAFFSLGWSNKGLELTIHVRDDSIFTNPTLPWRGDGIEIFLADSAGGVNMVHFFISPLPPGDSNRNFQFLDYRKDTLLVKKYQPTMEYKVSINDSGYTAKTVIPMRIVGKKPSPGTKAGMQLIVNDFDSFGDPGANQLHWHHMRNTVFNHYAMHSIELVVQKRPAINYSVKAYTIDNQELEILVYSRESLTRKDIRLKCANGEISNYGSQYLNERAKRLRVAFGAINSPQLEVYIDCKLVSRLHIEDLHKEYKLLDPPGQLEEEILAFEKNDRDSFPPANAVLFIGSSSIRMWKTLREDMEGITVINRGFGGSTGNDVLKYLDRVVIPYQPSKIVYYEGDNDLASGMDPDMFISITREFIQRVDENIPGCKIYLLSIKPSVRRKHLIDDVMHTNNLLEKLARDYNFVQFIDVSSAMFTDQGELRKDIFLSDSLHMNEEGYKIWTRIIRRELMN